MADDSDFENDITLTDSTESPIARKVPAKSNAKGNMDVSDTESEDGSDHGHLELLSSDEEKSTRKASPAREGLERDQNKDNEEVIEVNESSEGLPASIEPNTERDPPAILGDLGPPCSVPTCTLGITTTAEQCEESNTEVGEVQAFPLQCAPVPAARQTVSSSDSTSPNSSVGGSSPSSDGVESKPHREEPRQEAKPTPAKVMDKKPPKCAGPKISGSKSHDKELQQKKLGTKTSSKDMPPTPNKGTRSTSNPRTAITKKRPATKPKTLIPDKEASRAAIAAMAETVPSAPLRERNGKPNSNTNYAFLREKILGDIHDLDQQIASEDYTLMEELAMESEKGRRVSAKASPPKPKSPNAVEQIPSKPLTPPKASSPSKEEIVIDVSSPLNEAASSSSNNQSKCLKDCSKSIRVEVPVGPPPFTQYSCWRRDHAEKAEQSETTSIDASCKERLYAGGLKDKRLREAWAKDITERQEVWKEQLWECTFAPEISHYARSVRRAQERCPGQHKAALEMEVEEGRMKECTFNPQISERSKEIAHKNEREDTFNKLYRDGALKAERHNLLQTECIKIESALLQKDAPKLRDQSHLNMSGVSEAAELADQVQQALQSLLEKKDSLQMREIPDITPLLHQLTLEKEWARTNALQHTLKRLRENTEDPSAKGAISEYTFSPRINETSDKIVKCLRERNQSTTCESVHDKLYSARVVKVESPEKTIDKSAARKFSLPSACQERAEKRRGSRKGEEEEAPENTSRRRRSTSINSRNVLTLSYEREAWMKKREVAKAEQEEKQVAECTFHPDTKKMNIAWWKEPAEPVRPAKHERPVVHTSSNSIVESVAKTPSDTSSIPKSTPTKKDVTRETNVGCSYDAHLPSEGHVLLTELGARPISAACDSSSVTSTAASEISNTSSWMALLNDSCRARVIKGNKESSSIHTCGKALLRNQLSSQMGVINKLCSNWMAS